MAEKRLRCSCIYKSRHLLCGHFGSQYTQISFTTINKQLWPICYAVFLHWHRTVIYRLLLPAMRAADELGIKPEDSHFSSRFWLDGQVLEDVCLSRLRWWTVAESTGINCQYFDFPLGCNKTEHQPSPKKTTKTHNITDITLGGGEIRAWEQGAAQQLFIIRRMASLRHCQLLFFSLFYSPLLLAFLSKFWSNRSSINKDRKFLLY